MEHYKMTSLLNDSTASKFVTRKRIEVDNLSCGQYSANKNMRFKTPTLRSDLCNYSDAYIVVKERINVTGVNNPNRRNEKLDFKNNAPFRSYISKISNTIIDSAEDLDIIMPMYNLLEHSDNYSMTSGSLWNYYKDKVNDAANENNDAGNYGLNNNKTKTSRSSDNKTK